MARGKGSKKKPVPQVAPDRAAPSVKQQRRERAREASRLAGQQRWMLAGVLIITFAVYFNSLDGQFVYDDQLQILKNPTIKDTSNIPRMFTQSVWQFLNPADKEAAGPYYRPFFNIALIINYAMFELNVTGWHIFSVLIHLLVTLLVYLMAREWGLAREIAAIAALIFGVHPVHSESVAWIAALPDPLAGVFILVSLLLYERYFRKPERNLFMMGLSLAAMFFALMCKEVAIVFPVFLVARELLDREEGGLRPLALRLLERTGPYFAMTAIYLAIRYAVLGFITQEEASTVNIPATHVLMTVPSIALAYLRLLVVPYPMAVMYGNTYVTSMSDVRFWGATLALVAIGAALIWAIRKSKTAQRATLFAIIFILPVLNLKAFRPHESLLHDRYLYLPSIGFCLLVAMAVGWAAEKFSTRRKEILAAATVIVAVPYFAMTVMQNETWQNEIAMTDQAMKVTPEWPFLYNYLGAYYFQQKNLTEAARYYNEAIRINPNYFDSLSNLGDICLEQGKLKEAEQYYVKAIENGAPYSSTHYNLGVVYTQQYRLQEAERPLQKALELQPSYKDALYNLGWVYDNQGKPAEAEQMYLRTLQAYPNYPEPRINLGVVLTRQQRYKEALDHLLYAQRLVPEHTVMLYALGDVYMKTNREREAIEQFKKVAAREPNHRLVHTSLGLCYERLGDREQARQSFQRAIEVAPQDPYTNTAREHLAKL
ncbi:MAG: tetratricopeptide repeat protein [Acidobacteriota bacterium]